MPETLSLDLQADNQRLLAQTVVYYHRTLKETTEGVDFLRSRGITVGEAIDRFRIGYANRSLGLKLPIKQLTAGKETRARLQQIGLFRATGHEHFNGCVVFPITAADGSGHVVDIYGRKTYGLRLRKGTPLDMHLSDERRGVWNVEALQAGDEVILCSSLFDALTFWNAGFRNVTCTFGADERQETVPDGPTSRAESADPGPHPPKALPVGVEIAVPSAPPFLEAQRKERLTTRRLINDQPQDTVKLPGCDWRICGDDLDGRRLGHATGPDPAATFIPRDLSAPVSAVLFVCEEPG